MTDTTNHQDSTSEDESRRDQSGVTWHARALVGLFAMVCVLSLVASPVASAAASTAAGSNSIDTVRVFQENNTSLNETAPYYDNQSRVGNQSSWIPDGVTLESLGEIVTRFGPFIVGTGSPIPGGTTYAGTLITGLVMVGVFVGSITFANVGAPAGAVVATVAGYGLVSAGLAPSWLRAILVMLLATVAAVAALRITR